jgi:hypothetical protein
MGEKDGMDEPVSWVGVWTRWFDGIESVNVLSWTEEERAKTKRDAVYIGSSAV